MTNPLVVAFLVAASAISPVQTPASEPAPQVQTAVIEKQEFDYDLINSLMPPIPKQNSSAVGYNDKKSWWFVKNDTNTPPRAQQDINTTQYDAYYLGDVSKKVIYLTFDEGYENGLTPKILDILKANNVPAAFFVTKTYIKSEPDLVKRMVAEGHVVGNHSVTHPDVTSLSNEKIAEEINGCADYFKEVTGQEMPPFFRPPEGAYSIRSLEKTQALGYKTIFWSFAHRDWVVDDQPGVQKTYNEVMGHIHNGAIPLLHAVSQSNTDALDSIIKDLKAQGYEFKSLYELP